MDVDRYVRLVATGQHAQVGAPEPLLSEEERGRAVSCLRLLSPNGAPGPMLAALGLVRVDLPLPSTAPFALIIGAVVVRAGADVAVGQLLTFAGIAVVALRMRVATFNLSDVWHVAAGLVDAAQAAG